MSDQALKKIRDIEESFCKTPIVLVTVRYNNKNMCIYGKYEACSLSGSGKDRMARFVLADAYRTGKIRKGDCIIETTSGNAGIALSTLGSLLGNPVKVFIPDWMSPERFAIVKLLGAEIIKISNKDGGFVGCLNKTKELAKEEGYFAPQQFSNPLNVQAHFTTTMPELFGKLEELNINPSVFVAGYGTGGMVMSANKLVKAKNLNCSVHPLEPSSMALLTEGLKFKEGNSVHKIEGIMDDFVPDLLKPEELDNVVVIDDDDAIKIAQKVNNNGLSFGISSGANLLGCIKQMNANGSSVAATIFCDNSTKYYSTDLFKNVEPKESFLSNNIEILDLEFIY